MEIKLVYKNSKGRFTRLSKRANLKTYFRVKGSRKLLPLLQEGELELYARKLKYKNAGDFKSKLRQRAEILAADFVHQGILPQPDINFYDRKSRSSIKIKADEEYYTKQKRNFKKEHYQYTGSSKINQKNVFDFIGLNKLSDKRRFKKVKLQFKFTPIDSKGNITIGKDAPVINVGDLHRAMQQARKKYPKKLLKKMDFDVVNYVYFSMRNQLWRRMWSITPQAHKFTSEKTRQKQKIMAPARDKQGNIRKNKKTGKTIYKRIGYAPGRVHEMQKKFIIDIQVDYERIKKKK
jgi:hypothetical protein